MHLDCTRCVDIGKLTSGSLLLAMHVTFSQFRTVSQVEDAPLRSCALRVQELPKRPAGPPGGTVGFRNGLPLCTDCSAVAPDSPPSLRGVNTAADPISQESSRNPPHAVPLYVLAACVLFLLSLAVGIFFYCRRRMPQRDAAGRELHMCRRHCNGSTGRAAANAGLAGAGLGNTAVRAPPPASPNCHSSYFCLLGRPV